MPAREDGEYELILGNRQLLGVLFIVIVLLGVFFAMGFLAGRSTSPSVATTTRPKVEAELKRIDPTEEPAQPPTKSADPIVAQARVEPTPEPPPAKAAPPAKEDSPAPALPEVKPTAPPVKLTPPQSLQGVASAADLPDPPPGNYLQVAATTFNDAKGMLEMLKKNGHQGTLAKVPDRPELVRVVVGPLATKEATAEARERLRGLGIDNPMPRAYK
jgi:cell division septation protein DedD